jgi:D-alanine--poly(phosphoribitol) ligase subunit 1
MDYNLALPFYVHAERRPESVALRANGVNHSYGEFARRAQGVADWLPRSTPGDARRVAILGGRTWESYAGLLGACWSGAAYVPFSPKLPVARLKQVFELIQPDAVLFDADGERALASIAGSTLPPASRISSIDGSQSFRRPVDVDGEDPAYILFTSGSTGVPKGVAIACRGVFHFLAAMAERYPLTPEDRVAQPCDLSFDISVSNIFTAWASGAAVCVVPASQAMAPRDFLRNEAITVWFSTPSVAVFLEQLRMLRPGIFPALRYTMFGGEGLPATTAEKWVAAAPNGSLENVYGPTETSVACTSVKYTGPDVVTPGLGIVAIGTPFKGTDLIVSAGDGVDLPAGKPGELLIGGFQVGLGYWNDSAQTEARFPMINGKRWYRSGDIVYRDANGLFHFVSRVDDQVKVRGFRVELGEIEAHLRDVCYSNSVVALAWPTRAGSAAGIVAFVSGTESSAAQIRAALKDRLPDHLVPDQIRELETLPTGITGKFDRKALTAILEREE